MTIHTTLSRSLRLASLLNMIKAEGMTIEVGSDFLAYRRLRLPQAAMRPVYPMFDIASCYIDAGNGFWIAGHDAEGRLVHTQAMRLLPFGDGTLGDHLRVHGMKYVTPGLTATPEDASYHVGRPLSLLAGRVCYHGEFWVAGGPDGFRGGGMTNLLSRLMFELTQARFEPDYVFGFIDAANALNGTPMRHCYFHGEPGTWRLPTGRILAEEWLVWMSAADIQALLAEPVDAGVRAIERSAFGRRHRRAELAEVPADPRPEPLRTGTHDSTFVAF